MLTAQTPPQDAKLTCPSGPLAQKSKWQSITKSHHVPPAASSRASDPNHPDPLPQVSTTPEDVTRSAHSCAHLSQPPHSLSPSPHHDTTLPQKTMKETHIILLPHIHPPPLPPNPQPLLLAHLPHLPIMLLIPQRRRRRQEEGARQHGEQEGQPEGRERVFLQRHSVPRRDRVGGG